jgi:hypothetical protein
MFQLQAARTGIVSGRRARNGGLTKPAHIANEHGAHATHGLALKGLVGTGLNFHDGPAEVLRQNLLVP